MMGAALLAARASVARATAPVTGDPVITAVGDLACGTDDPNYNGGAGNATNCAERRVSNQMLTDTTVDTFLGLGDFQYTCGIATDWAASYTPTWGRFNSITEPVAGNHEYQTGKDPYGVTCPSTNNTAANYFNYFGAAASPSTAGHYSFNLGSWHLIALNANCAKSAAQGCAATSTQTQWLQNDLAFNAQPCIMAFWHQPYFQGNTAGAQTVYQPWWNLLYAAGADVVLNGHIHNYQRFGLLNPSGQADPNGIREVIVGTGGESLGPLPKTASPSPQFRLKTFGYLRMVLHPTGYDGQFYDSTGVLKDSFSGTCHSSGSPPPTLQISQDAPPPVVADGTMSFTVHVTNPGTAGQTGVTLTDTPPANTIFQSAQPSQGSCSGTTTVSCGLGSLAGGASATVTLVVTPIQPGTISNAASAVSNEASQVSSNQSGTVTAEPGVTYVSVGDSGFSPSFVTPPLGGIVQYNILGSASHDLSENMTGLFDTGPKAPVSYAREQFDAASWYTVTDSPSGRVASVRMSPTGPSTGTVGTPVTITWAANPPPAAYVEDIQVLQPGSSTWVNWLTSQTGLSGNYTPPTAGAYQFRARLRRPGVGPMSWSPTSTLTVS
jgi:uncharacterized repeat protein (TIGR01451 family)